MTSLFCYLIIVQMISAEKVRRFKLKCATMTDWWWKLTQPLAKFTGKRWLDPITNVPFVKLAFSQFSTCYNVLSSITAQKTPKIQFCFSLPLPDSSVSAAVKPLPCSAGHINPAGLWLYGSPAHTSVMRVNKQRAKGQQSPQNKEGRRGRHGEKREQARGSAQITVRASSRGWCTRQQPRTGND